MSDEDDIQQEAEEEKSIWEILEMDDPNESYEELQDDEDEELAKVSKMEKKLSAKGDEMVRKLERTILRERIVSFEKGADDMQKDLFKAIAGEVKDVESFDKAMKLVNERSQKLKDEEERYKKQLEEQAAQQVARAWGTGPQGTPTPRTKDEEEAVLKKIAEGDTHALFEDLMTNNWPEL